MRAVILIILACWRGQALAQAEKTEPHYKIQQFQNHPGMYYEKLGRMHYSRKTWKLVVKFDLTTLNRRHEQIEKYLQEARITCDNKILQLLHNETCLTFENIARRELDYLTKILTQINTIYKTSTDSRRGLMDGIGSIAKSLFGTMDANDEKRINEQLQLLGNNQQTLHHTMQNQIKVMNATIGHIEKLESIMERNRNLLEKRFTDYPNKDEIKEHFEIGIAVITDLIRDVENILEYLACIRKGTMHPKLMPVEDITWQLKEASQQLPPGSYFPFRVHLEDWFTIEKHTTIKAFYRIIKYIPSYFFP
ncbi:uncharacterized protein LOC143908569 [Temnothorax americanus]|uniref:uncharacterized protein LOC143908569 n=1 Tax=Temnothorax americanus TaxID=1964332 RepID=UPI004067B076